MYLIRHSTSSFTSVQILLCVEWFPREMNEWMNKLTERERDRVSIEYKSTNRRRRGIFILSFNWFCCSCLGYHSWIASFQIKLICDIRVNWLMSRPSWNCWCLLFCYRVCFPIHDNKLINNVCYSTWWY